MNRKSIEEALKFSVSDPKKMDGLSDKSENRSSVRANSAMEVCYGKRTKKAVG